MATVEPIRPKHRNLRTREEIFAAGFAESAGSPPLTEAQIDLLAALFAPTLNAPRATKRGAA